jgi:hypothetical protein
MRTRSTWQGKVAATPRQAATQRTADIYKMNQEHPDAGPIDYENGDPDSWAESWHGYGDVEKEYEGGHVKRNELNFAEFRDNTFKHKDSDNWHSGKGTYDNVVDGEGKFENTSGKSTGEKAGRTYEATGGKPSVSQTASGAPADRRDMAERKAAAVERIVRAALRTSNDKLVADVAIGYMGMPDRVIVATLRALDAVSPDALTPENKMRRAMACTKLAARLLGDNGSDKQIETLASTIMTIDDPTLKSVLGQLAAARVAQEQDDEEQGDKDGGKQGQQMVNGQQQVQSQMAPVGQQQDDEEQGAPPPPMPAQGQQQEQQGQQQQSQQEQAQQRFMQQQQQGQQQEQQGQQQMMGQEQDQGMPHMGHDLPPQELQMLDQMLKAEMAEQGVPGDDLTALFDAAPAQVAPPAPVMMTGATQQGGVQISFDDEDEGAPTGAATVAAQGDELDSLFNDNEEVQAQRAIHAAELEQQAREGGFSVQASGGRTASTRGAKKIGQVQRGKAASVDTTLENLWDRP